MSARNVTLTPHLTAFVEAQVDSGRHQNASEVVREALRRYEGELAAEAERINAIRAVIQEGREAIARGDYTGVATAEDQDDLLNWLTTGLPPGRRAAAR